MASLRPGDRAPDFTLTNFDGRPFKLSAALERGPVVLIFYPLDNSPRCTKLMCAINDEVREFRARGLTIVGVNSGDEDSHARFAERKHLELPLLSDPDALVAERYDAVFSIGPIRVIRYTVVGISRDGRIKFFHHGRPSNREIFAGMDTA